MNIYGIQLEEGDLSPKWHYVLAENFDDAYKQAVKLREKYLKTWEDTEILEVEKEFELEVVV